MNIYIYKDICIYSNRVSGSGFRSADLVNIALDGLFRYGVGHHDLIPILLVESFGLRVQGQEKPPLEC